MLGSSEGAAGGNVYMARDDGKAWFLTPKDSELSSLHWLGTWNSGLEGAFVPETASVHTVYLGVASLPSQVISSPQSLLCTPAGQLHQISFHPHCSEEPPSFLLDWVKDLFLSFPITIHFRHVVALISLIMACPLLDYRHFVVRVQALFLSATNKTSSDLSCANLLSQEASNQPPLFCPLSPATILFSTYSVPGGF